MVPNNPVTTSGHYDVLPVPLIHLGTGHAKDLLLLRLRGQGWADGVGVDAGQRAASNVPQVQPRPRAGDDVPGQVVDGHGGHGPGMVWQVFEVNVPEEQKKIIQLFVKLK